MEDDATFYADYWREMHEKEGLPTVRDRIAAASGSGRSVGEAYLRDLGEKQEDSKHEDAVGAVMDANKILAKANTLSKVAIGISVLSGGLSICVAFFQKG